MNRRVLLIGIGGALVIVLLWYFVLYSPRAKDLKDTKEQVTTAKNEETSKRASLRNLQALAKEGPSQQAELERLNAALPKTPDLAGFINAANTIAVESGVDWVSVSPSPPAVSTTGGPTVISLSMQVKGGFFQVLDYFNRLETLSRLVIVDNVSLSSATDTSGTGEVSTSSSPTVTASLSARMFTSGSVLPAGTPGATTGSTTVTTAGGATTTPSTSAGTASTAPIS